jgi:hypothetical protein
MWGLLSIHALVWADWLACRPGARQLLSLGSLAGWLAGSDSICKVQSRLAGWLVESLQAEASVKHCYFCCLTAGLLMA